MPIVRTIFHVLSLPCDTRDQVAANERKLLLRGYFSFIATVVCCANFCPLLEEEVKESA